MFRLSVVFITFVLFQSVLAAPVLLTTGTSALNDAAIALANRLGDGPPGRIHDISFRDMPDLDDEVDDINRRQSVGSGTVGRPRAREIRPIHVSPNPLEAVHGVSAYPNTEVRELPDSLIDHPQDDGSLLDPLSAPTSLVNHDGEGDGGLLDPAASLTSLVDPDDDGEDGDDDNDDDDGKDDGGDESEGEDDDNDGDSDSDEEDEDENGDEGNDDTDSDDGDNSNEEDDTDNGDSGEGDENVDSRPDIPRRPYRFPPPSRLSRSLPPC